jgi:FAD:protein FMN transferase
MRFGRLMGWFAAILMGGCATSSQVKYERYAYAELHMATMFSITLYAPSQAQADRAARAAFERIAALEDVMSDYDSRSELSRLCGAPYGQPVPVSRDLFRVLQLSLVTAEKSGGAFDPTVGPLVRLWRQSRKNHQLPSPGEIAAAQAAVGYRLLELDARRQTVTLKHAGMRLDLGGNGKGFAADEALLVLRQNGLRSAMVAASGDIALGDPPPGKKGWEIGIASIDHPDHGLTGALCLAHAGVSTSGDTEQFVEIQGRRYSHIVNPVTGLGLTHRIGVTIIAPNAAISDSLDTTISVLGPDKGMRLVESWPGVSALIVLLDEAGNQQLKSSRFERYLSASKP